MNNKRTIERIAIIALAAFLIAYFCYQVAYGMTMGPNGTMTITQGNVSATLRAPPGSTVTNFTIKAEPTSTKWIDFTNSTWTMYNSTSGSVSTMTFKTTVLDPVEPVTTFVRILHGHIHKGTVESITGYIGNADTGFELCGHKWHKGSDGLLHLGCEDWKITELSTNHMEFKDQHGGTIDLTRQVAYGESELIPISGKSYNAGFSGGYLGLPLKGHHTQQYLLGYINGTSLYESNRDGVFGYNGLPKDKDALYGKGTDLFKLGNFTGAILYYDKTLAIDPKDVRALTDKGVSLLKLGNYTGAIEYYDKALAIDPKHENALYSKGLTIYELGNDTGALTYLDKALTIDPKDEDALYENGVVLDKLGNHTGAIEYFDKALAIDPHDVDALNDKGAALNSLGNYTGAIEFYNKTLAIDPNNTFAFTNKDAILHMLGNNTTSGNATNFLEYENSTYGIKMQYPSDWQVEDASNSSIVASFNPQRSYASYVTIQIENLTTSYTPDQYLNSLMRGDTADYKDYPDIRFTNNTTSNIVLAGHPGYLLNGTFRDPTSDALQRFTNVGTIIGDKAYSVIYYSPAETYSVYNTIYLQMIKSFSTENTVATSTYENTTYGIQVRYPSDWSVQESRSSGELINIAAFLSPTGNPFPTAEVTVYMDRLHNSTTNLNNYAHFVAFTDYENRPSYFHAFKLLELNTKSSILAGRSAYTLIGTYELHSSGLQKLMEVGTDILNPTLIKQMRSYS